ncbi:MAG TPA: alpha/beta hydrolase, partial [Pirellulales bacterium]|nr:alpha/beta hydrolase [Pirellulales bacterium]
MASGLRRLAWLVAVASLIGWWGAAAFAADKPQRGEPMSKYPPDLPDAKVEVYKQLGDTALKLYIFSPTGETAGQQRPAIVFFFGGGWSAGSPNQFAQHCRYLASRGMVAITADYRVATRNNSQVVDSVRDAKSAIRWVREHAAELGVDPERIVAAGGSAGGHLAACTGTVEGFEHEGETTAISSKPNAMILFNPVGSLVLLEGDKIEPAQQRKLDELSSRFGTEARNISPAENVRPGDPPTVIFFGT